MKQMLRPWIGLTAAAAAIAIAGTSTVVGQKQDDFRFRSGVELVNVTATVTDKSGRFMPGLKQDDFIIYEDNVKQDVTHFSNERVPVSLGIVIDTSGSMAGEKLEYAQAAINRFLGELLDPQDEIFLTRFQSYPELVQDWTTDRKRLVRVVARLNAGGGTAMYDAVAEAVPMATTGEHRKKAILLISDGNDTDSDSSVGQVKQLIRNSEVMVYAIGVSPSGRTNFGCRTRLERNEPTQTASTSRGTSLAASIVRAGRFRVEPQRSIEPAHPHGAALRAVSRSGNGKIVWRNSLGPN